VSERRGSALPSRLGRAWKALTPEGRLAAFAALGLFVTMFLPWYQQNAVVDDRVVSPSLTAFGVFSFVEAAVLLVAIAVLVLLFARAEGRSFHLPGGDGTIVMVAGGWVALLLIWRLFDKPDLSGDGVGTVGIQWGIFFALGAAGLLAFAGSRMRAADRPEPQARASRRVSRPVAPAPPAPRMPDPPAERWPDPATEPLPEREPPAPTQPPAPEEAPTRRIRARPPEQTERLFDEG
jgi:hypothetical protein